MYDKHLESFFFVAQMGSFSSAAEKLYVSRTALIQQINLLESRIGAQLFKRNSKGVTLTEAGTYFLSEAKHIMNISRRTIERCRSMQDETAVRIGILPNLKSPLLTKICALFTARYPQTSIRFVECHLKDYFKNFEEGKFDITVDYIAGYIYDHPDYRVQKLCEDRHCCGIPQGHSLSGKNSVTLADLNGQGIMMYSRGITKADDRLRDYLLRTVPDIDIIGIDTYDISLSMKCELSNHILIYYSMYRNNFSPLITVPLELGMDFPIEIGIGYMADSPQTVLRFIDVVKSAYQKDGAQ
ncbi:MAG: LysR family transcriptional regulator [Clostridia bacterium]|nr:LysR family transcriptional regulator [Clostridia bacterium]